MDKKENSQNKTKIEIDSRVCAPRDVLLQSAMFRLGNIDEEVENGYEILRNHHKTVTIFGSARFTEENKYYQAARELGKKLAENGYSVVTGGGGGIMEAANRGAFEAGGGSVGFNISLPFEQNPNKFTTHETVFQHFAPRKIALTLHADAYICFPGGYGTLDELGEILTLIQTGKTLKAPIILYGEDFWHDFDVFIRKQMLSAAETVSPGDENLYQITDSLDQIVQAVIANDTYCDH